MQNGQIETKPHALPDVRLIVAASCADPAWRSAGAATIAATGATARNAAGTGHAESGLNCKAELAAQEYYVGAEVPGTGEPDEHKTERLFEHLAVRMNGYAPSAAGGRHENPSIPAGYTYLAQLAAHDLTINSESHVDLSSTAVSRNLQSRPLLLDTLYGKGPEVSGLCYRYETNPSGVSAHLRLDGVGKADGAAPKRDIGRLREGMGHTSVGRPLVADTRNDNNAVLSQLVALFSMVHNTAVTISERSDPDAPSFAHFKRARLATTSAYRSIVRNDLLTRLLDPQIHAYYNQSNDPGRFLIDLAEGNPVSREFSHAAFRMGHAMIRPFYRFNGRGESHGIVDVLNRTSAANPGETPLDRTWIAEWSRYFELGGGAHSDLQFSMRIGPGYNSALNSHFKKPGEGEVSGLAIRDLRRSAVSRIRKLSSLRKAIAEAAPDTIPHAAWLTDSKRHSQILIDWALRPVPPQGFGGLFPSAMPRDLVIEFASNPPLGLFVMIEASQAPWNGQSLGPLGSIIVAETFFRALDDDAPLCGDGGIELAQAEKLVFGGLRPVRMPELITWLDRNTTAADKVLPDGEELPII